MHKTLKELKLPFKEGSTNYQTMSGGSQFLGKTAIKLKIFQMEKNIAVCVADRKDFKYDFIIGLDTIKSFKLCQDENLIISQAPLEKETTKEKIENEINERNKFK